MSRVITAGPGIVKLHDIASAIEKLSALGTSTLRLHLSILTIGAGVIDVHLNMYDTEATLDVWHARIWQSRRRKTSNSESCREQAAQLRRDWRAGSPTPKGLASRQSNIQLQRNQFRKSWRSCANGASTRWANSRRLIRSNSGCGLAPKPSGFGNVPMGDLIGCLNLFSRRNRLTRTSSSKMKSKRLSRSSLCSAAF